MTNPNHHSSFEFIKQNEIPALKITLQEFKHKVTGCKHYHMATDNTENTFMVCFRTVPTDSSGVAHILEHTVLCGSKKFPVRDPFFMMTRRSLNSFMNAFTSADWTAYPLASPNKKDFNNLLEVYLDAAFFPNLNELDFKQEGHRIEFAEEGNIESPLKYSGVVLNEMKGVMSEVGRTLNEELKSKMFINSTYHNNSGGKPSDIPNLTYQQFKDFHATYYHPGNANFFTFGDIPAKEHQEKFEKFALNKFEAPTTIISIEKENRFSAPKKAEIDYPLDEEDTSKKTHVILSWLLGNTSDINSKMDAEFLEGILMYDSSAPLRKVLETTKLGSAPSSLSGMDDSYQELTFTCGLEGCEAKDADKISELIETTLKKIAKEGIAQERLESLLHQIELGERELESGSYPLGLTFILEAASAANYNGEVIEHLDIAPSLERLRQKIKEPNYIKDLINNLLLNNNHMVRLVAKPNNKLGEQNRKAEEDKLAEIKSNLSQDELIAIKELNQKLKERQLSYDNPDSLPTMELSDIPEDIKISETTNIENKPIKTTTFAKGTNGLVYETIIAKTPELSDEELKAMPYYTSFATQLGVGEKTYVETLEWQAKVSGGIGISSSMGTPYSKSNEVEAYVTISTKALDNNISEATNLAIETLNNVKFTEYSRIKELISQKRTYAEMAITSSGHIHAILAAKSHHNNVANMEFQNGGLPAIKKLREFDKNITDKKVEEFANTLAEIHNKIKSAPKQLLLIGEDKNLNAMQNALTDNLEESSENTTKFITPTATAARQQMWIADTDVNFCAKAYKTIPDDHADSAALQVLAPLMRNEYIHTAVRERGGAYGGFASYDRNLGVFNFGSYRDPRLTGTLEDFDKTIEWMLSTNHEEQKIHEAIFSVIQQIDNPLTPAASARDAFYNNLKGYTKEVRQAYRKSILEVTVDDLKRVTETYLKPELASTAVITNNATLEKGGNLGMEVFKI